MVRSMPTWVGPVAAEDRRGDGRAAPASPGPSESGGLWPSGRMGVRTRGLGGGEKSIQGLEARHGLIHLA